MISQHVTSLETSKRLKELGVKQESEFYWERRHHLESDKWVWGEGYRLVRTDKGHFYAAMVSIYVMYEKELKESRISAFLSSELLKILPEKVVLPGEHAYHDSINNTFTLEVEFENGKCIYYYSNGDENVFYKKENFRENEAEARGILVEYLLENGLITL